MWGKWEKLSSTAGHAILAGGQSVPRLECTLSSAHSICSPSRAEPPSAQIAEPAKKNPRQGNASPGVGWLRAALPRGLSRAPTPLAPFKCSRLYRSGHHLAAHQQRRPRHNIGNLPIVPRIFLAQSSDCSLRRGSLWQASGLPPRSKPGSWLAYAASRSFAHSILGRRRSRSE